MAATWKFDVTLLDLTGYSSDGALLYRDDDDRLVVRIHSSSESGLYDNFYVQEPRSTELQSTDGGLSWEPCEGQFPLPGVVTSSGKRVYIWNELLKGDRLWEHLDTEGIGHLYRPGAHMMHRLYRGEKRADLEARGLFLFDAFDGLVAALPEIVYGGLFATALAFTLQVFGQSHTTPAQASIFLSSEALFAALFGAIFLAERIAPIGYLGCAMILLAMLAVELVPLSAVGRRSQPVSCRRDA